MFPSLSLSLLKEDSRYSKYSYENYVEESEIRESLDKRDRVRYSSAIYDTANQKINSKYSSLPYGVKVPVHVTMRGKGGNMNTSTGSLLSTDDPLADFMDRSGSGSSSQIMKEEMDRNKMLSLAFESANKAKTADDPLQEYYSAARLFDKLDIHDRAIKYYLKAIVPMDPIEIVDSKQLPMTELEKRKIDRMGKPQKARHLEQREATRQRLITEEENRQERRIQDSHCRLFRLFLHLATVPTPDKPSLSHLSPDPTLINRSHGHLRASFRAVNPSRPEVYTIILWYASEVLLAYLPPCGPEEGIYLHSLSGSAGQLQEAHILILHELISVDENDEGSLSALGRRYAEKCQFEDARVYFKRARDAQERNRTPRYASSTSLLRSQCQSPSTTFALSHSSRSILRPEAQDDTTNNNRELNDPDRVRLLKEVRTVPVLPNTSSLQLGTEMSRTQLLDGKKIAIVKIPMSAYGTHEIDAEQEDYKEKEKIDYTSFTGCHQDSETRLYLPPSIGWKKHLSIVEDLHVDPSPSLLLIERERKKQNQNL